MVNEVLISLGDSKLKGISEVLGSKSCVRILEVLSEEDLTVTGISEKLGVKLNTVDYNVKKLVSVGLVEGKSHWWSVKGRKMRVYGVVDKRIVISPKRKVSAKFLLGLGLIGAFFAGIRYKMIGIPNGKVERIVMEDAVFGGSLRPVEMMASNAGISEAAIRSVSDVSFWGSLTGLDWFLFGVWSMAVLFFVYSFIAERKTRGLS